MYCVQCGVELQAGAEKCPLCGLRVCHPEVRETPEPRPYPAFAGGGERVRPGGLLLILSFLFALPIIICLMVDLRLSGGVTWSGYVSLGVCAAYIAVCLPLWFRRRNPVVFFPITMAAGLLLALYVWLNTGVSWFLPFACPMGGAVAARRSRWGRCACWWSFCCASASALRCGGGRCIPLWCSRCWG